MEDKKTTTYDLAQRILDKIRFLEESFKAITKVHHADEKALDLNLYFFLWRCRTSEGSCTPNE